eukprot:1912264-Prymnesium_polylepis.1
MCLSRLGLYDAFWAGSSVSVTARPSETASSLVCVCDALPSCREIGCCCVCVNCASRCRGRPVGVAC